MKFKNYPTPYLQEAHLAISKIYAESSASDSPSAAKMRLWNTAGKTPKFTKRQHSANKDCDAVEMLLWNNECSEDEKYTKAEHKAAKGISALEMRTWNKTGNSPKYTLQEIKGKTKANDTEAPVNSYAADNPRAVFPLVGRKTY